MSRKEREIRLRTMTRWDTEMKGQKHVKGNCDKLLEDLGREMKHCAYCKAGETHTPSQREERMGGQRVTVNQQS